MEEIQGLFRKETIMILYFIHTKDNIQSAVKQETSLLAERRYRELKGGEREELLDELVMDEEYDDLFKRLFRQAHAELITNISSNYLAETPTDLSPVFSEFPDFRQDRDFSLWLDMHEDFPPQYRKSIDIKTEQFLIDYVCYRWLENKSPNDARYFLLRQEKTLEDIKRLLVRKIIPMRRRPSFP